MQNERVSGALKFYEMDVNIHFDFAFLDFPWWDNLFIWSSFSLCKGSLITFSN